MKFQKLAGYFDKIEQTSSRLSITHMLAELFSALPAQDIRNTIYLLQGRVAPLYEKIEFSMAEKTVIKSIVLALNLERKLFIHQYQKTGDLGKTVEYFKKQVRLFDERDMTVGEVYDELYKLAVASGEGSQEVKVKTLAGLIRQLDPLSSRYISRIPTGVMRLGFSDMTVLDALSWMLNKDKSLRGTIEHAYHVRPDLGEIAHLVKEKGIRGVEDIRPKVFTPILMMRAERLPSGKEIVEKIGACAIEPKFDGFRLQVHCKKNGEVKLYSRNLENVTFMYPDIVEGIKKEVRADEAILEGEAIGFDPQSRTFLPFQETVQRKRKYDIAEKSKEIPLKLFTFELLYLDGKSLLSSHYAQRRAKLEHIIHSTRDLSKDTILIAPEIIAKDEKRVELEFEDAISKGLEGIIAKKLDGIYQAGARGWNWIKFKRSYSSKIEDTIDCLVMGYDLGKGKRADFGIGAFLVGVYDKKKDMFVTVAKIGTGLSDEEWKTLREKAQPLRTGEKPKNYVIDKAMDCDVWLNQHIVVEIKADEISRSPVHTAGRTLKSSKSGQAKEVDTPGFALRFPRLEHFRQDKKPYDATTLHELEQMFHSQKK